MNNKVKIALLSVLAIVVVYLLFYKSDNEVSSKSLKDFAIRDTANIDRIFLADNDGNQSLITRQADGTWMVNNKWRAKDNNVFLLLRGFYNMEVKSPVVKEAVPAILKQIAAKPIKVEVYMKGQKEPEKIYYFGFASSDHYGNYALLEIPGEGKSKEPYIVKEAGFYGFMRPRLITREKEWRYNGIFDYPEMDIASIKVDYPQHKDQSLSIKWNGGNDISLLNEIGEPYQSFDTSNVKNYLLLYKKIHIESFNNYLTQAQEDSVLKSTDPIASISVFNRSGEEVSVTIYNKGFIDPYSRLEEFNYIDPERYYILTDDNQLVIAQRLQWEPLLAPEEAFRPE
jgi:hypothetical protein